MNISKFNISIMSRIVSSIILLIILLVGQLQAQEQETTSETSQLAKDLTGAWVLAGRPGNVNENPQVKGGQFKFIAGGQWCITQSDSNGEVVYHHGGTYTLNGDEYIEKVEYANDSTSSLINTTLRFNMKVEGEFYTQTGIGNSYTQVWKRIKVSSASDKTSTDQVKMVELLTTQEQDIPLKYVTTRLAKDLTGAWVLAGRPGNFNENPQVKGSQLKFIAGGQWCITQSDSNGSIIYHHGGTYTLNGDEYIEKVEYANDSTSSLINTTLRFNMKVEGNFYTQTGIGNSYTQVWKRLKVSSASDNTSPDIRQARIVEQLSAQDQETQITSETSQLAKDLIGTWILAGRPGNVVDEPDVIGGELKFIAGGHWCVTQADPNGDVMIHHGGTYTLNGDEYVEHVEYATDYTSYLINTSHTFKIKIEGDTLTQVGIGNRWTQVRKRLKGSSISDNTSHKSEMVELTGEIADLVKSARTWKPAFKEWYGKPAPDFTITDISGKQHKISEYKGKNLILNFWATWCGPCLREIPDIIKLRNTVSEDELAILGISTEKGKTDLVKEFAEKEKMNYTILVSEGKLVPPYSEISAIPTTFIIDPKGNIKIATIGTLTLNDLNNLLNF